MIAITKETNVSTVHSWSLQLWHINDSSHGPIGVPNINTLAFDSHNRNWKSSQESSMHIIACFHSLEQTSPRPCHITFRQKERKLNVRVRGTYAKKRIAISNVTNVSTAHSWSSQLWLINDALHLPISFYVATWRGTCKHMYANIKVDWRLSEMLKA